MISDLPHCPSPGEIIEVAAPELSFAEDALTYVLEPLQPLREQLIAITGIGLEADTEAGEASLRRRSVPVPATVPSTGQDISVLAAGQMGGQRVVFIHGSPGLAEEWAPFLAAVPQGLLYLAPDRPGFGNSGEMPLAELQQQADALVPLLGRPSEPPVVLVGYSYGGPMALRLAADHPGRVAGLLLIGAAADPGLEEIHPLQEVAALEFFQQMLPAELTNSNAELMALRSGLEDLAPDLASLHMPVTIVQGTDDSLVPPSNADYLRARLPGAPASIMIEAADHFLPWSHPDLLADALDCLLQQATAQGSGSVFPEK
ncbi:alpha/beta fold hydrolase [Frigidibacter mobilis]|uniref:Alpha/beta hydrolase fold n=1 Tax=Frigidibacter mobilis TaxID=1335048 RepID=A0A159Z4L5_9RHOB|nr:alpha/beta hydrolase [Frigidibacter mobilis]AMY70131.1 alpha/beta hydrolase fold [Frigidibacter mobilis]